MNDDFNMLRPGDDLEPPDDSLDWLSAMQDHPVEEAASQPGVAMDDSLAWLQEFAVPDEDTSKVSSSEAAQPAVGSFEMPSEDDEDSDVPDWLQSDDLFEPAPSEPGTEDWMQSGGVFSVTDDPKSQSSTPSHDIPDWLRDDEQSDHVAAVSDTDLFAGLDEALGLPAAPVAKAPPPIASDTPANWMQEEPVSETSTEDLFARLGAAPPQPQPVPAHDDDSEPFPPPEEDLMGQLQLTDTNSGDWFTETEPPPVSAEGTPDWLTTLGDLPDLEEAPPVISESAAQAKLDLALAEDDFLAELRAEAPTATGQFEAEPSFPDFENFSAPGLQDIDTLLASYDSAPAVSQSDTNLSDVDFDRLLSDQDLEQISVRRTGDSRTNLPQLSPDAPDWLAEIGATVGSVGEVSAAAIVRKQTQSEKPLDDLSDRLFALHEAGLDLPESQDAGSADVIKNLLPGITQVLPSAALKTGLPGIVGQVTMIDEQNKRVNLLKSLVAVEDDKPRAAQPSAIDLTLASPNLDDLTEPDLDLDEKPAVVQAAPTTVPKIRVRTKWDRIVISILVALAVILPFLVGSLRIGDLPPAQFAAGSSQQNAYNRLDALKEGQLVLVAAEYGPTGAAELDSLLEALLRHTLIRGARPVIVSSNPIGLLHAQNSVEGLAQDASLLTRMERTTPLSANQDYYITRYLAGEVVGLRAFAQNLGGLIASDVNGQPTQLKAASLADFALVILVVERAEDARAWGEQITPLSAQPLVIGTGYSAAPLVEPYALAQSPGALSGIGGLLVGYRDAYTYRQMVDAGVSGIAPIIPSATPTTPVPTQPPPTPESIPEVTAEATSQSVPETGAASPTPEIIATTAQPSDTPPPTATETPLPPTETPTTELTPTPGASPTPRPTLTPSLTLTPQPTSAPVVIQGVIKSSDSVNVREGPGREFARVTAVRPGTVVQVIGRNGAADWLQIRLDDGTEGWVSAQLIEIQEPSTGATPTREGAFVDPNAVVGLISDISFYSPAQQPEETSEATSAPVISSASITPGTSTYRDERWYGMTLGLMAIIVVIALAALVNIVRGLFRRGK